MTPKRPIEIMNTCYAIARAHARRDEMIDGGDKIGVLAMNSAVDILEEQYNSQYRQWQILGGTSDIDSIALCGVGDFPTFRTDSADVESAEIASWLEDECTCIFSSFGGTNMNSEYCPVHDKPVHDKGCGNDRDLYEFATGR